MISISLEHFADGYIEYVLELVEQIEREDSLDCASTHAYLLARLNDGKRTIHHSEDWHNAAYALAAWTDELLLETAWEGRTWWNDHVLEAALFGTRLCSEQFFRLATDADRSQNKPVLRVYYDCVLLGFRGVYALAGFNAQQYNLPPTLEQWLSATQRSLEIDSLDSAPAKLHRRLSGAPPQADHRNIVWWTLAVCVLLVANVTVYSLLLPR